MTDRVADFETECEEAVSALRAALIELYDSVEADPANPQEVARRLGVNKTLTWNLARFVQSPDSRDAAGHVPGLTSMERLLRAAERDGAPAESLGRVRDAVRAFDRMVSVHVGDRASLELMLDSMGADRDDALALSRKLAFRGASGIYGVQARTRLMCWLSAPNADDPSRLDLAMLSGYSGFRRLRPSVRWPLFQLRHWGDVAATDEGRGWRPIDPAGPGPERVAMLSAFTRGVQPDVEAVRTPEGTDCVLMPGPIGKAGAFDCYRGEVLRAGAPRFRDEDESTGEFGVTITTPSEHLVFDVIVHRDLGFMLEPEALVFGRIFAHGEPTASRDDATRLPIRQKPTLLSGGPPAVATGLIPGYADMLRWTGRTLGWDLREFRGVRFALECPPLGSHIALRFPLPDAP